MDLKDFFETNSTSLEVIDVFEDYCEEKSTKKAALNAARRELCQEYFSEKDQYIIVLMTIYYCGLRNNLIDEKSRNELEKFSRKDAYDVFGDEDGKTVFETLESLLVTEPIKLQRKKISYKNPGSRNWNIGDIYAYPLTGEDCRKYNLEGKYAVIHCLEKEEVSSKITEIAFYLLVCRKDDLEKPLEKLLCEGVYLKANPTKRYYVFRLCSPHYQYPTDKLIHLGNVKSTFAPHDERPVPNKFFHGMISWDNFDSSLSSYYRFSRLS